MPLRQHAIGVIENFARLVDEDFQQIRIDLATSGQREGMLGHCLRQVPIGGSLLGGSVFRRSLLGCGLLSGSLLGSSLLGSGLFSVLGRSLFSGSLLSRSFFGGRLLAGSIACLKDTQRRRHLGSDVSMPVVDRSDRRVGLLVLARGCWSGHFLIGEQVLLFPSRIGMCTFVMHG